MMIGECQAEFRAFVYTPRPNGLMYNTRGSPSSPGGVHALLKPSKTQQQEAYNHFNFSFSFLPRSHLRHTILHKIAYISSPDERPQGVLSALFRDQTNTHKNRRSKGNKKSTIKISSQSTRFETKTKQQAVTDALITVNNFFPLLSISVYIESVWHCPPLN